ncbi:oligosaccharide flippase family protein [Altererythrobacter aurantiacus]|uniref:Oligosaccharide flippase family protein n=1 Tax=Parapontixanthobacter aurantiacus TaxID=1463599 RepID=A0A844ZHU3_9SPHN|nr:oligosaccharide flippase family protein [Parapontixanthobacter aurantiacus]MXO87003.1 oligosaccharide flippase family protein [Parapontixanthobacter aurantiacus]
MKRLATNIGWLLGGRGINAVLSLVYLALATRTLGIDGFGTFSIIVAMGQVITGIANFQTWQFIIRWGAGKEGPGQATGFAIALDLLSVAGGTVLAAVLCFTADLWLPLSGETLWIAFGYSVISLLSIRATPIGLLRLNFRYDLATLADSVQPVIRAIGAVLAAFYMPTVLGFVITWALSEVAVAIATWLVAMRDQRIDASAISLTRLPRQHPGAWTFVASTNLSGSLLVANKQFILLWVGAVGGEALAGGFRVAAQLGQALVELAKTISKAIFPELVHAKDQAMAIARRMANIALIGGVLAVLLSLLFGRWVIVIIAGEELRGVYWAMVILAIAGAIELVGASLESLLVSAERAGTAFLVRAIPLALAIIFMEAAMDWNGIKGAALAVMFASALAVIGFWVAILSQSRIRIVIEPSGEPAEGEAAGLEERERDARRL